MPTSVDECDRLWVVDSGMTDLLGSPQVIQSPAVLVFDLNTNKLLKRFEIPKNQIKAGSFFVNVVRINRSQFKLANIRHNLCYFSQKI